MYFACVEVMLLYLGAVWLLVGGTDSTASPTPTDYFTRLNYGVAAIKIKKVCVTSGYVSHMFHLPLPKMNEPDIRALNYTMPTACDHLCTRMAAIPETIQRLRSSMGDSVSKMMTQVYYMIPDLDRQVPRRRQRAIFDGLGQISSYLFGTAQLTDVDGLKAEIEAIKAFSSSSAEDSQRTRAGLQTYSKLTGDRLDAMNLIMNQERVAIQKIAEDIRTISDSNYYEYNAIAIMGNEIAAFVRAHDEVQTFKDGVSNLVHGVLTPSLISPEDISAAIASMAQTIIKEKRGTTLCYKSAHDVYASGYFNYARHGDELFIRIRVPYTAMSQLFVYRSEVIAMPVPGQQGLFTRLKDFPKIFAVGPLSNRIGEIKEVPSSGILDVNDVKCTELKNERVQFKFSMTYLSGYSGIVTLSRRRVRSNRKRFD